MPNKLNNKIVLAACGTLFVVLLSAWLVFFVLENKVKTAFENHQKEKLNSYVLEEKRNKLSKLEREFPSMEKDKDELNSMLIEKDKTVPFLRVLEKIASDSSCSIEIEPADVSKIKFEKASKTKKSQEEEDDSDLAKKNESQASTEQKKADEMAPLKDLPAFSIEVTGHFSSLVDFLDKLENIPYFVRPLILDISSGKKGDTATPGEGVLSAGSQASSEGQEVDEKNVKMNITFVVYGN